MPAQSKMPIKKRFNDEEITQLRELPIANALDALGLHWKADNTYTPQKAGVRSQRLNISVGTSVFEIIVTNLKWYDTRAGKGSGGAIDLTMHLYGESFSNAVNKLLKKTSEKKKAPTTKTPFFNPRTE